eukprot:526187-Pyramimonas_sp.AAC.1
MNGLDTILSSARRSRQDVVRTENGARCCAQDLAVTPHNDLRDDLLPPAEMPAKGKGNLLPAELPGRRLKT